jgi:transcriptional regulator with XRE-family HTH domain
LSDFLEHWASDSPENAKLAAQELLIAEVTESIWQAMEQAGVNQTELAKRMGATKGHVSQVLNGSRNMTLRTLADICSALGRHPRLTFEAATSGDPAQDFPQNRT